MSLFDESFPEDNLHISISTNQCQKTTNDSLLPIKDSSLSLNGDEDPPSSSSTMTGPISTASSSSVESNIQDKSNDYSKETTNSCNSDEKLENIDNDGCYSSLSPTTNKCEIIMKKKYFKTHKSHSYQDLHSDYTKKKYQHIQSKVQQYIASIKAQDDIRRKSKLKIINRHGSLPETMNNNYDGYSSANIFQRTLENLKQNNINNNDSSNDNNFIVENEINSKNNDISKIIFEKDQQITELKNQNDYIQSNLNNKIALAARYKRNVDHLQVELLQLKEREKRLRETSYNRYSLPTSYLLFSAGKATASTQTELLSDKIDIHDNFDDYLNFSETLDFLKINGNTVCGSNTTRNKIDSMITLNQDDEANNANIEVNIPSSNNNNNNNVIFNELRRRSNSNSMKKNFQKDNTNNKLNVDENSTLSLSEKSLDIQVISNNNGSDSAIESDVLFQIDDDDDDSDNDDDDISENINRPFLKRFKCIRKAAETKTLISADSNSITLKKKQKKKIKKRIYKNLFLKTFFGSCVKCCKDKDNSNSNNDKISYKDISMSDSMLVNN